MLKMLIGNNMFITTLRLPHNPIIKPGMSGLEGESGTNINGPSLIRVPDWIKNPLGRYYLYFAHHRGKYIRLAYADQIEEPWKIYAPGTLHLNQTACYHHIASPDVHVDEESQEIRMYFHGLYRGQGQITMLAKSKDGLHFTALSEVLGPFYFRVFKYNGLYYAVAKNHNLGGILLRSEEGVTAFELGADFIPNLRHAALWLQGKKLMIFYSRIGDAPEQILMSEVDLTKGWLDWTPSEPIPILKPEMDYEGITFPVQPSVPGIAKETVRQIRDPAIYTERERTYLLYSVAGEQGIAIAELI